MGSPVSSGEQPGRSDGELGGDAELPGAFGEVGVRNCGVSVGVNYATAPHSSARDRGSVRSWTILSAGQVGTLQHQIDGATQFLPAVDRFLKLNGFGGCANSRQ